MTVLSWLDELNIPSVYWCSSGDEDGVILTTKLWCRELTAKAALPARFPHHSDLTPEEVQSAVRERRPPDRNWTFVSVWHIDKPDDAPTYLPAPAAATDDAAPPVTYSTLLRQVARDNFSASWRRMASRYPDVYPDEAGAPEPAADGACSVLRQLLRRTYGREPAAVDAAGAAASAPRRPQATEQSRKTFSGLQSALAVLELSSAFVVISPYVQFTLRDVANFSCDVFARNRKAAFVGYQLLRAVAELHRRGVCAGDVRLHDVTVDETLWVRLRPRLDVLPPARPAPLSVGSCSEQEPEGLSALTQAWSSRRICNMTYLLALNRLAGRRFDDPAYHPVVPWVTDLTQHGDGWRDLTRSKYRLNKGDEQLNQQYRAGATAADQVAHHISDVLSEITYYVYMARRTPRSVLCKHVRAQWVPGEYPTSMVRLQDWTPDECVPQFYTDPTVFKSIHSDMADLELPKWADSVESFISRHRAALESDQVSAHLHHWIDLTFGYKLTGQAAVRAKNVCRHLAESGATLRRNGVLQLFSVPHPPRQMVLPYFSSLPPAEEDMLAARKQRNVARSVAADSGATSESADPAEPDLRSYVQVPVRAEVATHLPRGYQPAAALHRLEALSTFCAAARGSLTSCRRTRTLSAADVVEARRRRDVSAWLCLLLELCAPAAFRSLAPDAGLAQRLESARQALRDRRAPVCLLALRALVPHACAWVEDADTAAGDIVDGDDGRPPPSLSTLLRPELSPLPLPPHVRQLYDALAEYRALHDRQREQADRAGEASPQAAAAADLWVRRFSQRLTTLLTQLTDDSLLLLVPCVTHLLTARATGVLAAWHVFSPVAARLGPAHARHVFLEPLLRLYRRDAITCKSMKLFHRSFLLHVAVRLGHAAFTAHFIPPLIEAVGGDRDLAAPPEDATPTTSGCGGQPGRGHDDTPVASESTHTDTGVFRMDEDADEPVQKQPQHDVDSHDRTSVTSDDVTEVTDTTRHRPSSGCRVSDVAAESVMWLAHRLGPVMTSRHLARNLLRMLAVCYSDPDSLKEAADQRQGVYSRNMSGDSSSAKVLLCLCNIAELYGDQLILHQYLPHVTEVCDSAHRKLTSAVESALIGGLTLLLHVLPYLSDALLMNLLQESLLSEVFCPVLRTATDADLTFPSGAAGRIAVCFRWLSLVVMVTHRIGLEMSLPSLGGVVSQLAGMFGRVLKRQDSPGDQPSSPSDSDVRRRAREELVQVFTPALAHAMYVPLCHLLETLCTGASAEDAELIRDLCILHRQKSTRSGDSGGSAPQGIRSSRADGAASHTDNGGSGFGSVAPAIGNRIYVEPDELASRTSPTAASVGSALAGGCQQHIYKEMANGTRHLRGAWQAYWLNELAQVDSHINPKQIRVQTFEGHTAAVKEIHALDNENSFVSASKDRTVKLWSVRSQGDGGHRSTQQWTYSQHRRPVTGAAYLPACQRVASSDQQTLHLWDPFIGVCDATLELGNVTVVVAAPAPCPYLLCGTTESTIKLVDSRVAAAVCEWKTSAAPVGQVRCLTVSPSGRWLAAGHTQGTVTCIDLRTGRMLTCWRAHEAEIRQISALDDQAVVICSADPSLTVSGVHDAKTQATLRGLTESAHFLLTDNQDVITGTNTSRLGVCCGRDADAVFSSAKLKPECFKGVLSCMALLRANRLLLLGSEQGHIRLIY